MKKFLSILLVLLMVAVFVGCQAPADGTPAAEEPAAEEPAAEEPAAEEEEKKE